MDNQSLDGIVTLSASVLSSTSEIKNRIKKLLETKDEGFIKFIGDGILNDELPSKPHTSK